MTEVTEAISQWLRDSVAKLEEERGYCTLLPKHYGTVKCRQTKLSRRKPPYPEELCEVWWQVEFRPVLKGSEPKYLVNFIGGSTGWECYDLRDLLKHSDGSFSLCAGTEGRWDSLEIIDMAEIHSRLVAAAAVLQVNLE